MTNSEPNGAADGTTERIAEIENALAAPNAEPTFKKLLGQARVLNDKINESMTAREGESSIPSLSKVTVEDMPTVVRATSLALEAAQRGLDVDGVVRAALEVVTTDRAKIDEIRNEREEKRRSAAKQVEKQIEMDRKRYLLECEALAAERDKLAEARRALAGDRAATIAHMSKLKELDIARKEMNKERASLHAMMGKLADAERIRLTEVAKRDAQIATERRELAKREQQIVIERKELLKKETQIAAERKELADTERERLTQLAEMERNQQVEMAKNHAVIAAERKELDKLHKEMDKNRKELDKRLSQFEKKRASERNEIRETLAPLCDSTAKLTENVAYIQQALSHARIEMASKPKHVVEEPKIQSIRHRSSPQKATPRSSNEARYTPRKSNVQTLSRRTEPRSNNRSVIPRNQVTSNDVNDREETPDLSKNSDSTAEPRSTAPTASPNSSRAVVPAKTSGSSRASRMARRNSMEEPSDVNNSRALVLAKPRRMSELEKLQASLATASWVDERELEKKVTTTRAVRSKSEVNDSTERKSAKTRVARSKKIDEDDVVSVKKRTRIDGEERAKSVSSAKKKKRKSVLSYRKS